MPVNPLSLVGRRPTLCSLFYGHSCAVSLGTLFRVKALENTYSFIGPAGELYHSSADHDYVNSCRFCKAAQGLLQNVSLRLLPFINANSATKALLSKP